MQEILISIKLAFRNLKSNIGRTILSLLGIVIGVASVIIVLSLGTGVKDFVIGQVESFGTDFIEIEIKVPKTGKTSTQNATGLVGGTQITTLKLEDAEEVAKLENLGNWYAGIIDQRITSYKNTNEQTMILGTTSGVSEVDQQYEVVEGRHFSEEDDESLKQVIVIGSGIREKYFPTEDPIGKRIKVSDKSFEVIGVLAKRGSTGFLDFDNMIYIPIRTLQKRIMGTSHIQFILYKAKDISKAELTSLQMIDVMRSQHDIDDPEDDDFAVTSITEATDILDQVFAVINILLLVLTSISLIVGGVGIMNVMYVAVAERTFEIGLRKSLGAKKSDILKQFIFESIFITLLGGVAGIFIGFLTAVGAEVAVGYFGYSIGFPITLKIVLIGFGFSAATGLIFGLKPAYAASKLSPIEALGKR